MAKQTADVFTAELQLQRKRGRPKTGNAMTPAQRKRKSRMRGHDLVWRGSDYSVISTSSLLEEFSQCIYFGYSFYAERIAKELVGRSQKINEKRSKCIEGTENLDIYAPKKGSNVEDWNVVQDSAQHVEEIKPLYGVGWNAAYSVTIEDATRIYLVGEE